jgi:hypothetical protein
MAHFDPRPLTLATALERELRKLGQVVAEVDGALALFSTRPPTTLELRGAADLLHDWYCGVEKALEQVAQLLDGGLPTGAHWHRTLLERMSEEVPGVRPEVLSAEVAAEVDEFLRFRHLFRSLYGFELRWDRVAPLLEHLPRLHPRVVQDVARFVAFLRQLGAPT